MSAASLSEHLAGARAGAGHLSSTRQHATHPLFAAAVASSFLPPLPTPSPHRWALPFLLAALFAVGDAVWESQPPAVLQSSSFFPNERDRDAAMSSTCRAVSRQWLVGGREGGREKDFSALPPPLGCCLAQG